MDNKIIQTIMHEHAIYEVVLKGLMIDCVVREKDARIAVYNARYLLNKYLDEDPNWLKQLNSYDDFAIKSYAWEYCSEKEKKEAINASKEPAF